MSAPFADDRSEQRRQLDEEIANEPQLPPPGISSDAKPMPLEAHLAQKRPIAVNGIVENGLVRLLDPTIRLPENSHVIIVATPAK